MPRYERQNTWFTIEVDRDRLIIVNASGENVRRFASDNEAESAYDERVFAALQEGYRLAHDESERALPAGNPYDALERSLIERPDDFEAHLVYADLLMSRGDPRGELIAAHVEMQQNPKDRSIVRRAKGILEDHADVLMGPLEHLIEIGLEVEWKLGFIHRVVVELPFDTEEVTGDEASVIATVLQHPSMRFLRELSITRGRREDPVLDPLVEVIAELAPEALTKLTLRAGRGAHLEHGETLFTDLPGLRRLHLRVDELHLANLQVPPLETLVLEDFLPATVLRQIGGTKWPELGELDLCLNDFSHLTELAPLIAAHERLPRLHTFMVRYCGFPEQLLEHLLRSPLLEGLSVLGIVQSSLTDAAIDLLLENGSRFSRLERLDVTASVTSREGRQALASMPCKVAFNTRALPAYDDGDSDDEYYDEDME